MTIAAEIARSIESYVEEFNRQGFVVVRGALNDERADTVRESVLRAFAGPEDGYGPILRTKMFERGQAFEELLEASPVVDVAEALLGGNCHMFAMNAIKTPKGTGIDSWHVDEELFFPLPDGVEHDERTQIPTYLVTCIYYLVDVDDTMGPTQLVPGSHRSGRHPDAASDAPVCKGAGPVAITANKGDCLIFTGQTWHRGSRNRSDKERIVQQVMYGKRWISQRFYPFVNYTMPQDILDRAAGRPRRQRLLGLHGRGPYG